MKLLAKLLIAGAIGVGVAACEDTYGKGHGYNYYRSSPDAGRYDPYARGYDPYYDRDYDTGRPSWIWRGAKRYCLTPDNRYEYCGTNW